MFLIYYIWQRFGVPLLGISCFLLAALTIQEKWTYVWKLFQFSHIGLIAYLVSSLIFNYGQYRYPCKEWLRAKIYIWIFVFLPMVMGEMTTTFLNSDSNWTISMLTDSKAPGTLPFIGFFVVLLAYSMFWVEISEMKANYIQMKKEWEERKKAFK